MDNPVAANVLGTAGAVCWSVQLKLIPQIIINYRRHDTTGLQPTMMLLWACAGVPLGVYNIVENFNIALRIQPQILTFLSLVTWGQCKYYGNKWPMTKLFAVAVPVAAFMGGVECGLVFGLKRARAEHMHWPVIFMAVLSACLLSAGVLRHYWDIYKERTVRGISFIFVAIDALGDVTSLISVIFEPQLDILGMVIYGSEFILWCGVMACGGYYNFRPWMRRQLDKRESKRGRDTGMHRTQIYQQEEGAAVYSSSTVFRTASSSRQTRDDDDGASADIRFRSVARGVTEDRIVP